MAESLTAHALGLIALLILPVGMFVPKGMAVLFVVAGLIAVIKRVVSRRPFPALGLADYGLAGFVGLATISAAWSLDPIASLRSVSLLAGVFIGGWLAVNLARELTSRSREVLRNHVIVGGVLGFGLLALEAMSGGVLVRHLSALFDRSAPPEAVAATFKPGLTVAALFLWPWGLALAQRLGARIAVGAGALAVATIGLHASDSATLAVLAATAAAGTAAVLPRLARRCLDAAIIVVVLLMPVIAAFLPDPAQPGSRLDGLSNSAIHRIAIWRTASALIAETPIIGLGFNTSRMLYGADTQRLVRFMPDRNDGGFHSLAEPIPLHPHNFALQLWLELGLTGAVVSAAILLAWRRMIPQDAAVERATATGAFATALLIAAVSFGIWQTWWLATLFLTAMLLAGSLSVARTLRPG